MDEKKKSFIVMAVIGALLFLLVIIGVIQKENKEKTPDNKDQNQTNVTYEGKYSTSYNEAFTGEGKKLLYIGSSSCSVCTRFTPYIKYLSEKYDFTYYYIDAAKIDTEQLKAVLEKVGQDIDDFGTPYVVFLENGEKYDEIPGYVTESALFDQLKKNEIIGSDKSYVASDSSSSSSSSSDDSSYTSLSFIGYDKYDELYNGNEKFVVVLGQTGCGACSSFKPIINEIAKEKELTIYYVDMLKLEDDGAYKLMNSLSYFDDLESWGTPLTLVIENKEVIASLRGSNTKDTTLEFFEENHLIN